MINSQKKNYLKKFFNLISTKEKKRFLFIGILNVFFCNLLLQILLLNFPVSISTLFAQISSSLFGYCLYGKYVFFCKRSNSKSLILFSILSFTLWSTNWIGINSLILLGVHKQFAAIIMVPPLAIISFISQKFLIFKIN